MGNGFCTAADGKGVPESFGGSESGKTDHFASVSLFLFQYHAGA